MKVIKFVLLLVFMMFILGISSASAQNYTDVVSAVALGMLLENPELIVIDVSPAYDQGHLPRTVNYPLGEALDKAVMMLDKDKPYLVYCHVTQNAVAGAQQLADAGFMEVYMLEGNYSGWVDAGYPISMVTPYMEVMPQEALKLMMENPELIVIDVSPAYDQGHLPMAVNYPVGDGSLDEQIPMLDMTKSYLVYCHSESASVMGAQKLVDAGFDKIYRLEEEYSGWVDTGYPIEE